MLKINYKKKISIAQKLMSNGSYNESVKIYSELIKNQPRNYQVLYFCGVAHHKSGDLINAINMYTNSISLNPNFFEALENISDAQFDLGMYQAAYKNIKKALNLNNYKAETHVRIAKILIKLKKYKDAIDSCTTALDINPKFSAAYIVRSNAYRSLNFIESSISDINKAINIDPNNMDNYYNLSFDLLLIGRFEEGWICYEARFQTEAFLKNNPEMITPKWVGDHSLNGKTILVVPEQGLGDQIQFSRYALLLVMLGAKVILPVAPSLVNIIKSLHPQIEVISYVNSITNIPKHDFHTNLMSLPKIFNTNLKQIPYSNKYLTASPQIINLWKAKFQYYKKFNIGLAWTGNNSHSNDQNRSLELSQLKEFFHINADIHLLQIDLRECDQIEFSTSSIIDWRTHLTDMEQTAALIEQLDLVISADTSVAHLSAALGKNTWIMLPFSPDFRWLLDREDTPWYPSVTLFRQQDPDNWYSVVKKILNKINTIYPSLTR